MDCSGQVLNSQEEPMHIGEFAAKTGVNIETIRYYDPEGILTPPAHGTNNNRIYSVAHLRRLRFIRSVRDMDLSLAEVRALLTMIENDD
jgi:DNA-binding transcriptional MerR regulator